jgi:S-adenosylmethionine:tRNA ribosyltransferase-isomerase
MRQGKKEYRLEDFFYDLPENLIAQNPAESRDHSKLFILDRRSGEFRHSYFKSLPDYLNPGDLLVFNNTKVLHARIYCEKTTGGLLEIVLTRKISGNRWFVISNRTGRLKSHDKFHPVKNNKIIFTVKGRLDEYIEVECNEELTESLLEVIGEIPLPPYIKRGSNCMDHERYQTVYASKAGAAASPTAGLHFTDEIFTKLHDKGIKTEFVTLHVSWGTFSPVRENDLSKHKMHSEKFILEKKAAEKINSTRFSGGRIIAVGTTSLRVLESTYSGIENTASEGFTDIFIYPPYQVKSADALITNFHTPESTLLMLVSAFAGYELIMEAYREAIKMQYRFFSYGDSMLIL